MGCPRTGTCPPCDRVTRRLRPKQMPRGSHPFRSALADAGGGPWAAARARQRARPRAKECQVSTGVAAGARAGRARRRRGMGRACYGRVPRGSRRGRGARAPAPRVPAARRRRCARWRRWRLKCAGSFAKALARGSREALLGAKIGAEGTGQACAVCRSVVVGSGLDSGRDAAPSGCVVLHRTRGYQVGA